MKAMACSTGLLWRWLRVAALLALLAVQAWPPALAQEGDITLQGQFWIDPSAHASIADVADGGAAQLRPMDRHQALVLGNGALWMRYQLPQLDPGRRWYLLLSGAAYIDRASLFARNAAGAWQEQQAGDHLPVAQWNHPHHSPLFAVGQASAGTVWLRLQNQPAPASPYLQLVTEETLQQGRQWSYLLIGGYLGFGLLVFIVGLMHARMYADSSFNVYCMYVACMLLFQLAYTGFGGLFLWPRWAGFNDAAPALFMFLMIGSGIWFIREATALRRHAPRADRVVAGFCWFALLFSPVYLLATGAITYTILNAYALLSVALSIALCLWTWRKGETYSGWLFLGFLPIHLAYPFPALRAAGVLPDSWLTQYAVLIGSAIEIPLLLYILHRRAKDFSENRARMRVLDTTDPLTGLTIVPVLRLRVRDALRRARRSGHRFAVLLVELANHAEIVASEGREAGDRVLVVAAARLSALVRDVDTVCRVANTRFAVLMEGPQPDESRRLLAQHIVAHGLQPVPPLPEHLCLRFRVASAWVPEGGVDLPSEGADEQPLLERMDEAMDQLLDDPKKVVTHLGPRKATAEEAPASPMP